MMRDMLEEISVQVWKKNNMISSSFHWKNDKNLSK